MTPAAIVKEAMADGVRLALSPAGTIKAGGKQDAVNRWLLVIREHVCAAALVCTFRILSPKCTRSRRD